MRPNRGKRRAHLWPVALAVAVPGGGRALAVFGFEEAGPSGRTSLLPSEGRTGVRLG